MYYALLMQNIYQLAYQLSNCYSLYSTEASQNYILR